MDAAPIVSCRSSLRGIYLALQTRAASARKRLAGRGYELLEVPFFRLPGAEMSLVESSG